MKDMKKIIVLILILALMFMIFLKTGCEREEIPMISREQLIFANWPMRFHFQVMEDNQAIERSVDWLLVRTNPRYVGDVFELRFTDLVFVLNEGEAVGFPDYVIVAWPGDYTQDVVDRFNYAIGLREDDLEWRSSERGEFNLETFQEDFGLTYPLTVEDFVHNWEKVRDVFRYFTGVEQNQVAGR